MSSLLNEWLLSAILFRTILSKGISPFAYELFLIILAS